jgi:hypothetical protein
MQAYRNEFQIADSRAFEVYRIITDLPLDLVFAVNSGVDTLMLEEIVQIGQDVQAWRRVRYRAKIAGQDFVFELPTNKTDADFISMLQPYYIEPILIY